MLIKCVGFQFTTKYIKAHGVQLTNDHAVDLRLTQHAEQGHHVECRFTNKVYVWWRCCVHLKSRQQGTLCEEVWVVTEEAIVIAQE